ncbi:MAG: LysR substrate-binding domain-containing protein [Gammaproteobacteria bacterium]
MRSLSAFDAVARTGSVSDAASELGVSSGAISQLIQRLEMHLGTKLVERSGRGVRLTARGRAYRDQIAPALAVLSLAQQDIQRAQNTSALVISALPSPANTWVRSSLYAFRTRYPRAEIHLIGTESEPDLDEDKIDFRASYGRQSLRRQRYSELFTDVVCPVCSRSLLDKIQLREPADILRFPLLDIKWDQMFTPPPGWHDWFASLNVQAGKIRTVLSFSLSRAAIDAAVDGQGFVLAQRSMVERDLQSGRLIAPFTHTLPMPEPYFLCWSSTALKKPYGTPLHRWLLKARTQR